jgi:hypothetical protein
MEQCTDRIPSTEWPEEYWIDFNVDKFAQLIVRECIYAVVDTGGIDRYHYAEAISEHFGIKE